MNTAPPKLRLLTRFRRSDSARKFGRKVEKAAKKVIFGFFNAVIPDRKQYTLDELKDVRSVLIVRPNYRIGNTLISARIIPAVQKRFPHAEIDYLAAVETSSLLDNLNLHEIKTIDRSLRYNWFRFISFLHRLRKKKYDVVIDSSGGSASSVIICSLIGATYLIGLDAGRSRQLLNVRLSVEKVSHTYDQVGVLCLQFNPEDLSPPVPYYNVKTEEKNIAQNWLTEHGLAKEYETRHLVAVFAGGRLNKRWPGENWKELIRTINLTGVKTLLFTGPEEFQLIAEIQSMQLEHIVVVPMMTLRETAALCAETSLVISPDTGTIHLAAALHVPVVSILQVESSLRYAPKNKLDRQLMKPTIPGVMDALTTHPNWPGQVA